MPFKLLGANDSENAGNDEFFCIDPADALITGLSNVQRFVVRPTISVLPYEKREIGTLAAGKELVVDFVVEGNVQRAGSRIRVTAQLFLSSILWRVGETAKTLEFAQRAILLIGRTPYSLVWFASTHAAGDAVQAHKIIAEIEEMSKQRYVSSYLLAMIYVNLSKNCRRNIK